MLASNLIPRLEFALQSCFRRQRSCPFCESLETSIVARKHLTIRVRRCRVCLLYFTDPIYRSGVADLYDSLYSAEGLTTSLPSPAVLADLRATEFALSDKNCSQQIEAIKRLTDERRLLELGSSWGYFLYQARAAGFSAIGVEPGRRRREFGQRSLGVDIRESTKAVGHDTFAIIYSAHTLEHIGEVGAFLQDCSNLLQPEGLFVIEVPHFDLVNLGKDVLSIIGAVHPLGLSRPFFERALPSVGLRVMGIYNSWSAVPSYPMSDYQQGVLIIVAKKEAGQSR